MSNAYQLSRRAKVGWGTALVVVPTLSIGTVFAITDDGLVPYQNSALAQQYAGPTATAGTEADPVVFPTKYGRPGGPTTLVVYDALTTHPEHAELYAIVTANLATHFGEVEIVTTEEYSENLMAEFDAAIYIGAEYRPQLPQELVDDVRRGTVPVLWIDQNADHLIGGVSPTGEDFVTQYGWDPDDLVRVASQDVHHVEYQGRTVTRATIATDEVHTPRIVDPDVVEVVATGICGDPADPAPCDTDSPQEVTELPWVVRSGNLTYVAELPLHYIDHNELYLVFADLYYDLLAPDTEPSRRAAVRFEDVGPEADPQDLRAVADYLHAQDIPFQVAVVPIMIAPTPDGEDWYGLSLLDAPEVVEALKYMQERGGTLVQHGTTHQYGDLKNPYSGRSGEDYEFYDYGCSRTEFPPYEWEECQQDSWVRRIGPVPQDDVEDHLARLDHGRRIMVEAGLGEPSIFETPHYTASVNAYRAMAQAYDARYEQVEYYAGMISSGELDPDQTFAQVFPYSVSDIYGSTVYPENLQNVTETEQNNHPVRTPRTLIDRAEANLVVTESTASFYFHPFLDLEYLEELVTGIGDLGYTFVAVDELA